MPESVSIVIPILNAEPYLPKLLPVLLDQQGIHLKEIILMDSNSSDRSRDIAATFEKTTLLPEPSFSHGGTRNRGIEAAASEVVVLLTQDALPSTKDCLQNLIHPLQQPEVAYTFSRQVPYPGTNPIERAHVEDAFPPTPKRYASPSGTALSSPDQVFCSNVCAALKKSVWQEHRFSEELIMGEDQHFSKQIQEAGFVVVYTPDSIVTHSHNYTLGQSFRRYFDSVVALDHIFPESQTPSTELSGLGFLRKEITYLFAQAPLWIPYYVVFLFTRRAATFLAHHADQLPKRMCKALSMHKGFWK